MISIHCSGCNKKYAIPRDKLPEGKTVSVRCPACNGRITIDPEEVSESGQDPELMQKIIKTSKALPPMPQIISKATQLLSDDNTGFKEIGKLLENDQAMATRVLRIANSAYYSLSVPVSSVQQASALLGFQTLFELITVVSSSKMMGQRLEGYGIAAKDAWKHSLAVATAAKEIADRKFPEFVSDAFMAGLMHDAGMLILDAKMVSEKDSFAKHMEAGRTIAQAEAVVFGFDHAEIAAEYLKKWKLPAAQLQAIRYHHYPSQSSKDTLSYILHVADVIANLDSDLEQNAALENGALKFVGMTTDEMESMTVEVSEAVDQLVESFEG